MLKINEIYQRLIDAISEAVLFPQGLQEPKSDEDLALFSAQESLVLGLSALQSKNNSNLQAGHLDLSGLHFFNRAIEQSPHPNKTALKLWTLIFTALNEINYNPQLKSIDLTSCELGGYVDGPTLSTMFSHIPNTVVTINLSKNSLYDVFCKYGSASIKENNFALKKFFSSLSSVRSLNLSHNQFYFSVHERTIGHDINLKYALSSISPSVEELTFSNTSGDPYTLLHIFGSIPATVSQIYDTEENFPQREVIAAARIMAVFDHARHVTLDETSKKRLLLTLENACVLANRPDRLTAIKKTFNRIVDKINREDDDPYVNKLSKLDWNDVPNIFGLFDDVAVFYFDSTGKVRDVGEEKDFINTLQKADTVRLQFAHCSPFLFNKGVSLVEAFQLIQEHATNLQLLFDPDSALGVSKNHIDICSTISHIIAVRKTIAHIKGEGIGSTWCKDQTSRQRKLKDQADAAMRLAFGEVDSLGLLAKLKNCSTTNELKSEGQQVIREFLEAVLEHIISNEKLRTTDENFAILSRHNSAQSYLTQPSEKIIDAIKKIALNQASGEMPKPNF